MREREAAGTEPEPDAVPAAPAPPAPPGPPGTGLGERLRAQRLRRGLSLRGLADRLGVSASLLSRIETGKARPSLTTLYGLTAELGLSLDELLGASEAAPGRSDDRRPVAPAGAAAGPPAEPGGVAVRRAGERPEIRMDSGVRWDLLGSDPRLDFELIHLVYEPGGASSEDGALLRHAGRELGMVISGRLRVTVGFDTHELGPGDSIAFDSSTPHRFVNAGADPVHAVWLNLGRQSGAASRIRL
jgi:transcriptional regulator with XRE-family HTH domain